MGADAQVLPHITSANIACGFHAGDPGWMARTVRLAEENGVAVGAHPSFPDLPGFGRRNMSLTPQEARDTVLYQVGALTAFTKEKRLQHVKAHGAMYNLAADGGDLAKAICQATLDADPNAILVVLAGSPWVRVAWDMGLRVAQEAFADRALNADGTLVSRSRPGAVLHDLEEVVERACAWSRAPGSGHHRRGGRVYADTLCLHGDTPAPWRWPQPFARAWRRRKWRLPPREAGAPERQLNVPPLPAARISPPETAP